MPVKPPAVGKSRLRRSVARANLLDSLVEAIALDTIAAACAVSGDVLVVTGSETIAAEAVALGAKVIAEPALSQGDAAAVREAGLNAAIEHAELLIGHGRARAAMTADLPALRPDELRDALAAAARTERCFVADHHGIGTTLLSAPAGVPLNPLFGGGSAHAHEASGAIALRGAWPGLRLDVDEATDLEAARALGLGARTRRHIVINDKPTTAP